VSDRQEKARRIAKKFSLHPGDIEVELDFIDERLNEIRRPREFAGTKEQRRYVSQLRNIARKIAMLAGSRNLPQELRKRITEQGIPDALNSLITLCDETLDRHPVPKRSDGYRKRLACHRASYLLWIYKGAPEKGNYTREDLRALAAMLYGADIDSDDMRSAWDSFSKLTYDSRNWPYDGWSGEPGQK
jgi:hypothetical protein